MLSHLVGQGSYPNFFRNLSYINTAQGFIQLAFIGTFVFMLIKYKVKYYKFGIIYVIILIIMNPMVYFHLIRHNFKIQAIVLPILFVVLNTIILLIYFLYSHNKLDRTDQLVLDSE